MHINRRSVIYVLVEVGNKFLNLRLDPRYIQSQGLGFRAQGMMNPQPMIPVALKEPSRKKVAGGKNNLLRKWWT